MSFLYLKDGVVEVTEEGKTLPQIIALKNSDKTEGKKYYQDVCTYVYYVYKIDGIYKDQFLTPRKKLVISRHLPKRNWEDLEKNKRVSDVIQEYIDRQTTKSERLLYFLENDIDQLISRITDVPFTKKGIVKITHIDDEGVETIKEAIVDVDNYKEKQELYKTAENMMQYMKQLKAKVKEDSVIKKKDTSYRLFDNKHM